MSLLRNGFVPFENDLDNCIPRVLEALIAPNLHALFLTLFHYACWWLEIGWVLLSLVRTQTKDNC
jgi:hypothetical protein